MDSEGCLYPSSRDNLSTDLGCVLRISSSANFLHVHSTKHVWCVTALAFHPVYVSYLLSHPIFHIHTFTPSCLLICIHSPDTTCLHQQAQMALSQSGTIKSKSDYANIRNTPVQSPLSCSTVMGQGLQWVSAIPGTKGRRAWRMLRGWWCRCVGQVMRLRWVNVLWGGWLAWNWGLVLWSLNRVRELIGCHTSIESLLGICESEVIAVLVLCMALQVLVWWFHDVHGLK